MQDNHPKEFDEQFIDQAWLKMHQLLDQEMPTPPRRRAAWWLWLLAGVFLIIIMGGAAYTLYFKGGTTRLSSPPGTPTANQVRPTTFDPVEIQAPKIEIGSEQKDHGLKHTTASESVSATLPQGAISELQKHDGNAKLDQQIAVPGAAVGKRQETKQVYPGNLAVKQERGPEEEMALILSSDDSLGAEKQEISQIAPIAFLPVKSSLILPLHEERQTIEAPLPAISPSVTIKLAAEGGIYFPAQLAIGGYSGGLALEAFPKESRLFLRSGVFFRACHQNLKTEENKLRLENSFTKIPHANGGFANSTSNLTVSSNITAARYIYFPLSAGFQWRPGLAFEAGLQVGFLLSSKATNRWSLSNESNIQGGGPQEDNTIFEFGETSAKDMLNPASLDIIAGLSYRSSARTSLRLTYQYGLSDILSATKEESFFRGVQFSFSYYIIP